MEGTVAENRSIQPLEVIGKRIAPAALVLSLVMGETKQRFALLSSPSEPLSKSTEWEKRQKRKPFGNEKGSFKLCHENGRAKLRPKAATSFGAEAACGAVVVQPQSYDVGREREPEK